MIIFILELQPSNRFVVSQTRTGVTCDVQSSILGLDGDILNLAIIQDCINILAWRHQDIVTNRFVIVVKKSARRVFLLLAISAFYFFSNVVDNILNSVGNVPGCNWTIISFLIS